MYWSYTVYIYMCVFVCVCVGVGWGGDGGIQSSIKDIQEAFKVVSFTGKFLPR